MRGVMICICERISLREVPLSDVETFAAPVKHCFTPMRGCVYICATTSVSSEHAHSMDGHSEMGLHLELIDLAGTTCIRG